MTLARQLAAFVTRSSWEEVSAEARQALKLRVLDSLGCALGALDGEPIASVRAQVEDFGGRPPCTLTGGGRSAPDRFQKVPNFGGVDLRVMGDAGHNMNPFHFWAPEFKNAGVRLVDHDDDALAALGPFPSVFVDEGVDRVSAGVRRVDLYTIHEEIEKARNVIEVHDRNHAG